MACVGSASDAAGPTIRVVEARAVLDRVSAGSATFEEALAAGDMLVDLPAEAVLRVTGYGVVCDVQPLGDGFAVLAGAPIAGGSEGDAATGAAHNAVIRFDAEGVEAARAEFASRIESALITRLSVSPNGALAATRVDASQDGPFPSLETVFFESNLQTSTRTFTASRANGGWWGAQWLALGWGMRGDSGGGKGSPALEGEAGQQAAAGGDAESASYLCVRYDLTVAMDGGLPGGGEDPEPGGGAPADEREDMPLPSAPKPLSATGDGSVPVCALVVLACTALAIAGAGGRLAKRKAR